MIPISEAYKIIKQQVFSLETETISLENSVNRLLAQSIKADMDLPPFDRSQMDGFALKFEDTRDVPVKLKVIGESVAGKGFDGNLNFGEAVRIMTGARIPKGANAVQKVELTKENRNFVEVLEKAKELQNIVLRGQEIKKGTKIFKKGEIITQQNIATLASFGYANLKVFKRPKVLVLSTGSEIVDVSEKPQKDQIRNSNSLMLKALAEQFADVQILPLIEDDFENLKLRLAEILGSKNLKNKKADSGVSIKDFRKQFSTTKFEISSFRKSQNAKYEIDYPDKETKPAKNEISAGTNQIDEWNQNPDILIITGGVSVGDYDFTKPALREIGAEIFFEKVSLKPGKPTVFGRMNDTLIFGLPGNPVSVAVTFYLFVRMAILGMQKAKNMKLEKGFAVVKSDKIRGAKERDSVLPVRLSTTSKGKLIVESLRFSGSSNFIEFAQANGLVFIPQNRDILKNNTAEIYFLS